MSAPSLQTLLLIDTSGPTGTIALAVDGTLVSKRESEQARDHAAIINIAIEEILQEGSARMADLTGICVMAGPGSYTGLRIGLATAKGFCYALEIPLFLQRNLEVLAADARASLPNHEAYLVVLPARSGEYFLAAYNGAGRALIPPRHAMKAEVVLLLNSLPANAVTCGSESAAAEVCSTLPILFVAHGDKVKVWIDAATAQIARGESTPLAEAVPYYLKAAFTTKPKTHIKQ